MEEKDVEIYFFRSKRKYGIVLLIFLTFFDREEDFIDGGEDDEDGDDFGDNEDDLDFGSGERIFS